MRLVYTKTGDAVVVGDIIELSNGDNVKVIYFTKPHKSSSQGHVSVHLTGDQYDDQFDQEYFVSVIGAEWIEREDR